MFGGFVGDSREFPALGCSVRGVFFFFLFFFLTMSDATGKVAKFLLILARFLFGFM